MQSLNRPPCTCRRLTRGYAVQSKQEPFVRWLKGEGMRFKRPHENGPNWLAKTVRPSLATAAPTDTANAALPPEPFLQPETAAEQQPEAGPLQDGPKAPRKLRQARVGRHPRACAGVQPLDGSPAGHHQAQGRGGKVGPGGQCAPDQVRQGNGGDPGRAQDAAEGAADGGRTRAGTGWQAGVRAGRYRGRPSPPPSADYEADIVS
jgi:hypothetical protein